MIGAMRQYSREEVLPRWRRIIWQPQVAFAVALVWFTSFYGAQLPAAGLKMSELTTIPLTYSAIAFGFCIAGMALVLTLPSEHFVSLLMKHRLGRNTQNSYSDLLFVFSWTAIIHWIAVLMSIIAVCVRGGDRTVLTVDDGVAWRYFVGAIVGVSLYGLIQFLLTVITLSEVGRLYMKKTSETSRE
jgi:hypothetical protein